LEGGKWEALLNSDAVSGLGIRFLKFEIVEFARTAAPAAATLCDAVREDHVDVR
jgi:hypothetical protein